MLVKTNSFSLVEVLIFTVIISTFFVISLSIVVTSLRNLKYNEHKILATHYAKQLEDWLRSQKEIDWGGSPCFGSCCLTVCGFTERVTDGGLNTKFCFNEPSNLNWNSPDPAGCDGDYSLGGLFAREASFQSPADNFISQVDVDITVSWSEIGQAKSYSTKTVFSILEQ